MSDIKTYGSPDNIAFYWVREDAQFSGAQSILISIDELGQVTRTSARRKADPAALSIDEAILEHLGEAIRQADTHLEKRRKELDLEEVEETEPEVPPSLATRRFLGDWV